MSSDATTEMSSDLVFDLLSSGRRRMLLYFLRERGGSASVKELAQHIAALENEVDVEDISRDQEKRVYVSLYQTHLPKLAEAGVIKYHKDEGQVMLTDQALEMDQYLTQPSGMEYPWQLHYLILAAVSAVLLGFSLTDVSIFGNGSLVWIGILITVGFAISAVVHFLAVRRRVRSIPSELRRDGPDK